MRETRVAAALLAAALVLAAFNLRPAIASAGALLEEIQAGLHMSGAVAGLLTSIPAACFALFGALAPRLIRRYGPVVLGAAAMGALAIGLALRPYAPGSAVFLLLSALALGGIALGNVVMPVVVKSRFPTRIGLMTGLYTMALTAGASLAAAVTVPLTGALGGDWRLGLAAWAVPAALAAVALFCVRGLRAPAPAPSDAPVEPSPRLFRSRTSWALAVFFGLQAAGAYITLGWVPKIYRDAGISADTAGLLLALIPAVGVPFAFFLPTVAARLRSQSWPAVVLSAIGLLGYAGLYAVPATASWLWPVLLGISQACFPLALTMVGLRARSTRGVAGLSAFAQSLGYLISMPAPAVVGLLHDHFGGWHVPIVFMAALLIPQGAAGWIAGRPRFVD